MMETTIEAVWLITHCNQSYRPAANSDNYDVANEPADEDVGVDMPLDFE